MRALSDTALFRNNDKEEEEKEEERKEEQFQISGKCSFHLSDVF